VPSSSPASADELRLSFGNAAEDYERGRPGWPDAVAEVGGLPPSADVLDLGAGTGKLTRVLARRFAGVTAVEPDAAMRAVLCRVTSCREVLEGSAEAIPLADDSVDGVFCADCFHWFDWQVAIAEIERVLRPRGVLVMCFHAGGTETDPPYPQEARAAFRRYRPRGVEGGGAIYESGTWRQPFASSTFEPLREDLFEHDELLGPDAMISLALSQSVIAMLPEEARVALAAELRSILPAVTYRLPVRDEIYWTRLR
jgi:SAM-dependent methyltransferase